MGKIGIVAKTGSHRQAILKSRVLAADAATVGGRLLTGGLSALNCANPECAAPFNFRQGQLLRLCHYHPKGNAHSVNQYSLKHFWLCKQCTEIYTLENREGGAMLIPLAALRHLSAAAYSGASMPR